MTPTPVAVVIACYDLGHTVEEAVDSALAQTRPPAEIVVVDDGSTDVITRQVLARLTRPRTRVVTVPHGGVATARNHGVALTQSPYVVFLDADDALAPKHLERLAGRLDADSSLSFVSCSVQAFEGARYVWTPPSTTVVGTLTRGSVHVSSMFRRTVWDAVGGFDPGLPAYEDLDFWLHALRRGFRGEILDEALLFYRVRAGSRYRRGVEAATYRETMRRILERHHAVLDAHGIEVLAAKDAFLVQLAAYHHQLRARRDALAGDLARVDDEIAEARRALAAGVGNPVETTAPGVHHDIERFLTDWRWLVRGAVAVVADAPSSLTSVHVPRWDAGEVETRSLRETLPPRSKDCVILITLSSAIAIDDAIARVAPAVKPGGALVVVTAAPEATLAAVLAGAFPLDAFETGAMATCATACVRVPGGERLPRRRFFPRGSPVPPPQRGLVLAYHRIADLTPDTHGLCVAPKAFREQLQYLRDHCTPMPLVDLVFAARAAALPPRAVALTFDDGYLDALTTAAPLLEEAGIPATFFVNTERLEMPHEAWHDVVEHVLLGPAALPPVLDLGSLRVPVGTAEQRRQALLALHGALLSATASERDAMIERLLVWSGVLRPRRPERRLLLADEIRALSTVPGCDIGSHSTHHLLLPRHAAELQRREISDARTALVALLDRPVLAFAYPFGEHDDAVATMARDTPHLLAVTVQPGLVTPSTDPMKIPRVEVRSGDLAAFTTMIDRLFALPKDGRPAPRIEPSPAVGGVDFGDLRRLTPVSRAWGFDRGLPIDRYYIDGFIARHAGDVQGDVLEVGDDHCTRRHGGDRVRRSDVLHVRHRTPGVTIVADLTAADHIPSDHFDCVIIMQTLQLIADVPAAVRTVHRILRPGGVVLATVPGITKVVHDDRGDDQWWTFTTRSARRVFEAVFPPSSIEVEAHGNLLAATAFLQGLAVAELTVEELDHSDPEYDVVITVRAVKRTPGADGA